MKYTYNQILLACISSAILLLGQAPAYGATTTWQNGTVDLTAAGNWVPSLPTSSDTGDFTNTGNLTPSLTSVSTSNLFLIGDINFTSNAQTYNFIIQGPVSFNVFQQGVMNHAGLSAIQTFNINQSAALEFHNASSADALLNGAVTYNVGTTSGGNSPGFLRFNDSSNAGAAQIHAVAGANVSFLENSSANRSAISLDGATISFANNSTASKAIINLNNDSVLTFTDSSSAGQSLVNITQNAVMDLGQSADGEFTASVLGSGKINKTGTGTLRFLVDNGSFAGVTNVQAGNLALESNLGGSVIVASGAKLSGNGKVIGSLAVEGTISPGDSIGTLTVDGSFVQLSNSTYQVQVHETGQASLINVAGTPGTATIQADTTVNVTPIPFQLQANQRFIVPILHADGGLSGTYTYLTSSNPLIRALLTYDPNDVFLTFQNTFSLLGNNSNERAVADQLQLITNPTKEEALALNAIASRPPREAERVLRQLSGEQYTFALFAAQESTERFLRRLFDPVRTIISTDPCCSYAPCNCSSPLEPWISGGYVHSSMKSTKAAQGFHGNGYEISFGVQDRLNRFWTVGVAGAYQKDKLHYGLGGTGSNRTGLGAFYALYRPSSFYFMGDLVVGFSKQHLNRPIDIDNSFCLSKSSKPETFQTALYIEAGKDFWIECMLFQPFIGLETGFYRRNHIKEHHDVLFDITVLEKSIGTASTRLGMHFNSQFMNCFELSADLAWRYQINSIDNHIETRFATFGLEFETDGVNWGRNSVDGALNLSYLICNCVEIYAEADGQWWDKASAYSLIGGLKARW